MSEQLCPSCAWTNSVPDQFEDAIVACPECGQVLAARGWESADIPICDTRRMIAWADSPHPSTPVGWYSKFA